MKKILLLAGMGLGSFLVINVAMYFFLSSTQPKMGARSDVAHPAATAHGADSTAHKAAEGKPGETVAKAEAPVEHATPADSVQKTAAADTTHEPPAVAATEEPHPEPVAASLAGGDVPEPKAEAAASDTASESEGSSDPNIEKAALAAKVGGDAELAKLAKLLETLKPDEAANIASELSTEQIVALVMRMKDRTAGKMLAALPTELSAKVAVRMSQAVAKTRSRS